MSDACSQCLEGAKGELGHAALAFYVTGPYPGQHIYKCTTCDERWIRHCGLDERFGWTRYAEQIPMRKPMPVRPRARMAAP